MTSDLLEDADQVGPGAQVGHVQHVCEGGQHLHLVQNLKHGRNENKDSFHFDGKIHLSVKLCPLSTHLTSAGCADNQQSLSFWRSLLEQHQESLNRGVRGE